MHDYTINNADDITEAVYGLDIFTKNWCMKCKETKEQNEPVFNCSDCEFANEVTDECLIKAFAINHKHKYDLNKFGSMSR